MKLSIANTLMALSLSFAALGLAHADPVIKTNFDGCAPEKTVYFAYSADHEKAVEFCEVGGGFRYSYGPIHKAETQFIVKPADAGVIQTEHGNRFAIRKGNITYWTSVGRDGSDILILSKDNWSRGHRLSIIYLESGMGYVNKANQGYKAYTY